MTEDALGQEGGPVPEREGDEDESGKCGELEFENRDKELNRQDKEGNQDHQPGQQHDCDRDQIVKEADLAHFPRKIEELAGAD